MNPSLPCPHPCAWMGIDVSKLTLHVAIQRGSTRLYRPFLNTAEGCEQILLWLAELQIDPTDVHVCLESTGIYSRLATLFFFEHGILVSVINPRLLTHFRKSKNLVRKTDKQDALLLAQFARQEEPRPWKPGPAAADEIHKLMSYREYLLKLQGQDRNQLEALLEHDWIWEETQKRYERITASLAQVDARLHALVHQDEDLHEIYELLQTIPGVGPVVAAIAIAVIGDIERFASPAALVNYVGLAVVEKESGTSVFMRPHISRRGRAELRCTLYMGAARVKTCNPVIRAWAARLEARGKAPKVVTVAIMRKLVHVIYAIWKTRKPYEAAKAFALCA